nr:Asp23/Gls24 family envelope stress response protein [bacterium]
MIKDNRKQMGGQTDAGLPTLQEIGGIDMPVMQKTPNGAIHVTENVLAVLAGVAVEDCAGIVGMASGKAMDGINELLRRENYGRGCKVTVADGGLQVQLKVIVEYGTSIAAVAQSAMDMVRYRMESMTGMPVKHVEISVEGIRVR